MQVKVLIKSSEDGTLGRVRRGVAIVHAIFQGEVESGLNRRINF